MKLIALRSTATSLITLVVFAFLLSSSEAQTKTPFIPANGFVPETKQLVKDCDTNWAAANILVKEIQAAYKDKEITRVDPKKIGAAYARAAQVQRDAIALRDFREPSGIDFFYRASYQKQMLEQAAGDIRRTKNGLKVAQGAEVDFGSHANKRVSGIKKAYSLLAKNKVADAERTFDDLLKKVDSYYVWLSKSSRDVLATESEETKRKLDAMVTQMRVAQTSKGFTDALTKNKPNADRLLDLTESAVKSIGTTGKATLAGKELDGPDTLKQLVSFWRISHANLTHSMGIQQLRSNMEIGVKPKDLLGTKLGVDSYENAIGALSKKMSSHLAELVKADMNRIGTSNDRVKYTRYLMSLGDLKNNAPESVIRACANELAAAESGVGTLATSIQNYTKVTDDILLWRARAATSQANAAGEYNGIWSIMEISESKKIVPNLQMGMDAAITVLGDGIVGKGATANNLTSISDKAAFSSYASGCWATVIGGYDLTDEIAQLEQDLFVSETNPPLSLSAATAIATAKRKNITKVGGLVTGLQVEAIGTRFSTLPASMSQLVPLDSAPDLGGKARLNASLMRFNLKPDWIQHDYFFKKL